MTNQLAEVDEKLKPGEGQIQGPIMNAVCRIIRCELFLHCFGECAYPFQKSRVEKELKDNGHIIGCNWVYCPLCRTFNGHGNLPDGGGNCPNRFGTPHINRL